MNSFKFKKCNILLFIVFNISLLFIIEILFQKICSCSLMDKVFPSEGKDRSSILLMNTIIDCYLSFDIFLIIFNELYNLKDKLVYCYKQDYN